MCIRPLSTRRSAASRVLISRAAHAGAAPACQLPIQSQRGAHQQVPAFLAEGGKLLTTRLARFGINLFAAERNNASMAIIKPGGRSTFSARPARQLCSGSLKHVSEPTTRH